MATPGIAGGIALWLSVVGSTVKPEERQVKAMEWLKTVCSRPEERNPARGYGLPDFGKVSELGTTPPKDTPGQPPQGEKVYTLDLVKLKADGYTSIRIIGVGGVSPEPGAALQPTPVPVAVPTWSGFNPAPQFTSPPPVYQTMPQQCPGGVCPQPRLFPRIFR